MIVTNRSKTAREKTRNGVSVWWLLTREMGVPNFEMRYLELEKGQCTTLGKHPWEHEVFVVKGWGVLRGKGQELELVEGDAAFVPAGEEHQFVNPWEDTLGLVCVVPKNTQSVMRQRGGTQSAFDE